MKKHKFKNIIVFTAAGIGDFIWATSALSLIKQYDKNINITLIMCENYVSLLDKRLQIDKIITLKRKYHVIETNVIVRLIYKILWSVKNFSEFYSCDICFMFEHSLFFKLIAKYLYRIDKIIDYDYMDALPSIHSMMKYQLMIRSIFSTHNLSIPILPNTKHISMQLCDLLCNSKHYKIAVCTKSNSILKDWNINYFNELIKKINEEYKTTFFIVGKNKKEIKNGEYLIRENNNSDIRNLCGKLNLLETKELLSNMNLLVSVDTGVVHLAAVSNIPTISFYGFSVPEKSMGINHRMININLKENCSPCFLEYYSNNFSCKYQKCLYNITPDIVFEKIKEILK